MIRTLVCAMGAAMFCLGTSHAQGVAVASFNIVSEDASEQRRIVSVRVERRLDETDLVRLATLVQSRSKHSYGRTQVNVYLPAMALNQGPWATVTLSPEPKVAVFGLSRADEDIFLADHRADRRPLLGAWLTSPPAAPGRLAIYSDQSKIYAEWRLRSGQRTVEEVQDSVTKAGRRFDVPGAGYYVLTRSGELEIWDKSTLIATAERIRPEHLSLPPAVAFGPKTYAPVEAHAAPAMIRPAAAAQPDTKETSSVTATARITPVAPPATLTPVAPAAPAADAVAAADPEPAVRTATNKKIAKTHTRTKTVQTTRAVAQAKPAAKQAYDTPGDAIAAKMAGRL